MIRNLAVLLLFILVKLTHAEHLQTVTIQFPWKHQFQFAGFYMAKEKGFYKDVGLNVEFLEHHHNDILKELITRQTDFAIFNSGIVNHYLKGTPVVALGAVYQQSPLVWLTLAKSYINYPEDLIGKKVTIVNGYEESELSHMLHINGIANEQLNITNVSYGVDDLIEGKVDAIDAYISNEPYNLKEKNIAYNIIRPSDYGIEFYGDVLITSRALAEENPELAEKFRKASFKGWEYALNHIEESIDVILHHYNSSLKKSYDALFYEANALKRLTYYPIVQVGYMNIKRWEEIATTYNMHQNVSEEELKDFIFQAPTNRASLYLNIVLIFFLVFLVVFVAREIYNSLIEKNLIKEKEQLQILTSRLMLEAEKNTILLDENKQFIGDTVHQIRTPLSVIMSNVSLIQMMSRNIKISPYVKQINSAINMLSNSYEDLAYLISDKSINYAKRNINASLFVQSRIEFFGSTIEINHKTLVEEIEQDVFLYMNDIELERIIDNNLSNAINHSQVNATIKIVLKQQDGKVVLEFISDGPPIKKSEEVFEKNYTENSTAKRSLGLGLYMVKGICEKNQISFKVSSVNNTNIFTYNFPHSDE